MKLTHLLNKRIIISRMVASIGETLVFSTVTAKMGHIQPMADANNELAEGVYGQTFRLYMDADAGLQEGDYLRDESNNFYKVKSGGVTRRSFGSIDYLVVILERIKSE